MAEKLEINIDLATGKAVEATKPFIEGLEKAEEKTVKLTISVEKLEGSLEELTKAQNQVAESAKNETAATQQNTAAINAQTRFLQEQIEEKKKAAEAAKAAKKAAEDEAMTISGLMTKWAQSIDVVQAAYRGMQIAREILQQIEEQTKRVIEAQNQLVGNRQDAVTKLRDLMSNLNLGMDPKGLDKTIAFKNQFSMATGANDQQAVEILSQALASGIKVQDNTKGGGFDISKQVGIFAARTGLDSETAGNLFKIFQLSGGKSEDDMKNILAKLEAASRNTAITKPADFVKAAITSSATRMGQGVSFEQAVSSLIAAAPGEVDPSRMAENVRVFARVAQGTDPEKQKQLALSAMQTGLLKESDVAAAQLLPDDAAAFKSQKLSLENRQRQMGIRTENYKAQDAMDETTEKQEELDIASERAAIKRKPGPDSKDRLAKLELREQAFKQRKEDRQRQRELRKADADADEKTLQNDLANYTRQEREARAGVAYQKLPQAAKEELLYKITEGKSPQEISTYLARIAGPDQAALMASQLYTAGREARKVGMADMATATPAMIDQLNTVFEFDETNVQNKAAAKKAAANITSITSTQSKVKSLEDEVTESVKRQEARGELNIGYWTEYNSGSELHDQRHRHENTAEGNVKTGRTKEGIIGTQLALAAKDRFIRFFNAMTPDQKSRWRETFNKMIASINGDLTTISYRANSMNSENALVIARKLTNNLQKTMDDINEIEGNNIRPNFPVEPLPGYRYKGEPNRITDYRRGPDLLPDSAPAVGIDKPMFPVLTPDKTAGVITPEEEPTFYGTPGQQFQHEVFRPRDSELPAQAPTDYLPQMQGPPPANQQSSITNIHVGQYFSASGGDADFTGRLEGVV